jgi:hypothetical protein
VDKGWLIFIELFVVLGFALGWGVLELVALRMDRRKREQAGSEKAKSENAGAEPPE